MVVLSIFSGICFYVNNTSFFFHWHLFFYFISNSNCRLSTINIVSFIFYYYRESKRPFGLHYEQSSPLNIVYRKINWEHPAPISTYTQSEYRISNYVNHIRIIMTYTCWWSQHIWLFYYTLLFTKPKPHVIKIIYGRGKFVGNFNLGTL